MGAPTGVGAPIRRDRRSRTDSDDRDTSWSNEGLVPTPRLERGTPRSTIWCSNQLSYVGTARGITGSKTTLQDRLAAGPAAMETPATSGSFEEMGINRESDVAANLQIGPTTLGMVRLYIEAENMEIPLDFEPDEAEEIAEELRAAAARARTMGRKAEGGRVRKRRRESDPDR